MDSSNKLKQDVVLYKNRISDFTSTFIKEKTGKGPTYVKVKVEENYIHLEIVGYLTKYEMYLVKQHGITETVNILRDESLKVLKSDYLRGLKSIINQEIKIVSKHRDLEKEKINLKLKIM